MSAPDVTVVVPTRDRAAALERCLVSLGRLEGVSTEVIVVDDGSREGGRVARAAADAGARLVRLAGVGASAARNAGVRAAQGGIVCFTDDDCLPEPGWARALAAAVESGAAAAGGVTTAAPSATPFDRAAETVTGHLRAFSFARTPSRGFLASNNVACLRRVAEQVPFDERFRVGGEDRDWCARVAARVGAPVLVPEAVVVHDPGLTLPRFWRQQRQYGRGAAMLAGGAIPRLQPPAFYAGLLRAGVRQGPAVAVLVVLAQVATLVGVLDAWARGEGRGRSA